MHGPMLRKVVIATSQVYSNIGVDTEESDKKTSNKVFGGGTAHNTNLVKSPTIALPP